MNSARLLLRTAGGTAVGMAGLGALGIGVLCVEALWAASHDYLPAGSAPTVGGTYGQPSGRLAPSRPLRLAVLGDSTGAGVGVRRSADTVGVRLAQALAADGRRVILDGVAVSGSRTVDLGPQVSRALAHGRPDVAVILVGTDDATHSTPASGLERDLEDAVRRLRAAGTGVVVGTCPDMGAVRAFARPLREFVAWRGRRVAAAQCRAAERADAVPVDLAGMTGAVFRADPGTLSQDGFHPSADGYRLWAEALLPAVREATARASAQR